MATAVTEAQRIALAERAVELVRSDLGEARRLAQQVLAEGPRGPEAASVAHRALALVDLHGERPRDALRHADAAVAVAAGFRRREGEARLTRVAVLGNLGAFDDARREADAAAGLLDDPVALVRLESQRALVARQADAPGEAVACYDRAFTLLARLAGTPDPVTVATLHHNRGTVLLEIGDVGRAHADLAHALELHRALSHDGAARAAATNLARLHALEGDLPRALAMFEELGRAGGGDDSPLALYDLAEALLTARLAGDAFAAATRAASACDDAQNGWGPVARLLQAQAALLLGDAAAASELASGAAADLAARRPATAALAGLVDVAARWANGERTPGLAAEAARTATEVERAGLDAHVAEAHVVAGRVLLALGEGTVAVPLLTRAARDLTHPVRGIRLHGLLAHAMLQHLGGGRAAAMRTLRSALVALDEQAAGTGGLELQRATLDAGEAVAELGLRLASESGSARALLAWAERSRAAIFRLVPVTPPADPELRGLLARLRSLASPAAAADAAADAAAVRERARLERAIRHRARVVTGGPARAAPVVTPSQLVETLDGRSLVELVELDGSLVAVVVARGRVRRVDLGPSEEVVSCARLLARHQRRAVAARDDAGAERALRAGDDAARELDAAVSAPLARLVRDDDVVVVPTTALADVPWGTLALLRDRAFVVSPSASLWARAERRRLTAGPDLPGPALLVAGPRLARASEEVSRLRRLYEDALVLEGAEATANSVLERLPAVGLAHLAAHGELRGDNPLFSAVELSDGPLTAYDLALLERLPAVVVLAACDVGQLAPLPELALLGLASTLLHLGVGCVVASSSPVHDASMVDISAVLHRALVGGASPGAALAAVRTAAWTDPRAAASARALVAAGAG